MNVGYKHSYTLQLQIFQLLLDCDTCIQYLRSTFSSKALPRSYRPVKLRCSVKDVADYDDYDNGSNLAS